MSRRSRREAKRAARLAQEQAANSAVPLPTVGCEKRASSLTPRRLRFALLWAEADPDDRLQDVALRAGYSESVAKSGMVAELCRDPAVVKLRDQRLLELQQAAAVTVEETLIGLRDLARDPAVPPKDRVAARRALLAWYARDKGQHAPGSSSGASPARGRGITDQMRSELEVEILGVALDDEAP